MKRHLLKVAAAVCTVAALSGLVILAQNLPERFWPKIEKAYVTRRVDNMHGTYWTYTLRLTGHNFTTKSKVEIDGQVEGRHLYDMAGRDVMSIRVILGSWSRVYKKPKKYKVNVLNPGGYRSKVVEVTW